ncbi:MAG: carbohydrate ABC transporter permease [Alphaproteobacteria bacterium]|nr:carbohydrate ABC transporter permease [Alphaproteobacteria bacterium]TAD89840.1 MAG: carbohydrate ABC transporter permease [Alphaproteobacteria bacterium]
MSGPAAEPPVKLALVHALLWFNTALMLYPILIVIFSGFKSTSEIYNTPFALPAGLNLENFRTIWAETNFPRYLANSLVVTVGSVASILTLGTLAAYGLARYRFRGNELIYLFFLAGLMVPLKLAIIPLFIQLTALGLINTHAGLILVYTAMGLPAAVFILTGFLRTLPRELEESARIDGASEARILWSVMLPLARPAMVIAGIHNAVPIWNDFFFPLVLIQADHAKTLPQGLTVFMGEFNTEWGVLFAGLTLAALPIVLVYILLSRQFIAGLTHGAVK